MVLIVDNIEVCDPSQKVNSTEYIVYSIILVNGNYQNHNDSLSEILCKIVLIFVNMMFFHGVDKFLVIFRGLSNI